MKSLRYESKEEWLAARRGKITGSRLKDIIVKRGTGKKIGFYELIAERLGIPADTDENPMDRGTRLEPEAIARFEAETGKKVDTSLVLWMREDSDHIAVSPDGFIETGKGKKKAITEAVETKCLGSARHIEAYLTQEIPDEYKMQALQYFIVNDKLETLHFVFFDPRLVSKDYFVIPVHRAAVQEEVDSYLEYQHATLAEVEAIVTQLSF
ncbi:MAG: YqaJ viral recombinase family protein [Pseudolabrys sp.]